MATISELTEARVLESLAGVVDPELGLALVASAKNYKLIVVIPDKMSTEKIQHLHGLGADVRITCSIERRRPVGSGPPMIDTNPLVTVRALLHDRASASATSPTLGSSPGANGGSPRRGTFSATRRVAGSHPAISAIPS